MSLSFLLLLLHKLTHFSKVSNVLNGGATTISIILMIFLTGPRIYW